jgi:hypothetical protein
MKRLAIGISDFREIIEENRYFVDKSLFIKDIVDGDDKITLIPRPRRFGKTLNLSMLRYFYEKPISESENDNAHLFKDLKIGQAGEKYRSKLGRHPVIFLSFKDVKNRNWEQCLTALKIEIAGEYQRHSYLLNHNTDNASYINSIIDETNDEIKFQNSLKHLCKLLYQYHGVNPVVLIDEYDMPIQAGYVNGYYDEVIEFMRNFLSGGFKDNRYLERGVLTGILRVAKESIFSGLNNVEVCSLISDKYANHFGFLEEDVFELLDYREIKYDKQEVRDWYNGYFIGGYEIYNPWSVLQFVTNKGTFRPYWINTSGNQLVMDLIARSDGTSKNDLNELLNGKAIRKKIDDNIVFADIHKSSDHIWNFLFFSGYLKNSNCEFKNRKLYCDLVIPNDEVLSFYETTILDWFEIDGKRFDAENFEKSLLSGDIDSFKVLFTKYAVNALSYFDVKGDEPEKFYHAFVLGMMFHYQNIYEIKSNRESGVGRYDVMLVPKDTTKYGYVIEFKTVQKVLNETLESAAHKALKQINEKKYRTELENKSIINIKEIAIAFEGKEILFKEGKL